MLLNIALTEFMPFLQGEWLHIPCNSAHNINNTEFFVYKFYGEKVNFLVEISQTLFSLPPMYWQGSPFFIVFKVPTLFQTNRSN